MPAVSFPVTRPLGRALVVGSSAFRQEPTRLLRQQGFDCAESDNPYAAMLELCRHRLNFRALILCLAGFYREELNFIATVKRRLPHVEIWLTQTDGRMSALIEAMNLGADGVLAEDGTLHRLGPAQTPSSAPSVSDAQPFSMPRRDGDGPNGGTELLSEEESSPASSPTEHPSSLTGSTGTGSKMESSFGSVDSGQDDVAMGEPVLTADELRALLQDQPAMPPSGGDRND